MIITSSESEIVVYRGGFDSEMNREGFGIEYDRSTGEPLYSGVFKKDTLFQISQEFVNSTKMIEYQLEEESNMKARARHPLYVGGSNGILSLESIRDMVKEERLIQ